MLRLASKINSVFKSSECGTALVVDDWGLDSVRWQSLLTAVFGYRVLIAESLDEALRLIRHQTFDLIVSGVDVPGFARLELLTTVKVEPEFASIPFVLVSSTFAENKERLIAFLLGADAFVEGPADTNAFINEIQFCLHNSATSR